MLDKLAKHNIVHKNKAANLKSAIQPARERALSHFAQNSKPPDEGGFFISSPHLTFRLTASGNTPPLAVVQPPHRRCPTSRHTPSKEAARTPADGSVLQPFREIPHGLLLLGKPLRPQPDIRPSRRHQIGPGRDSGRTADTGLHRPPSSSPAPASPAAP